MKRFKILSVLLAVMLLTIVTGCTTFNKGKLVVATAPCEDCIAPATNLNTGLVIVSNDISFKETIQFDHDSYILRKDQINVIDKILSKMDANKEFTIVIDGYASVEGPTIYNGKLSLKRATAVKEELIRRGASPDRIETTVGRGETNMWGNTLEKNRVVKVSPSE